MWKKKNCFRKQNKKITEMWSRLTRLAFVSWGRRWTETKKKNDENQIKNPNPNPNREKREKRAIERREERIKIKRGINLIYKRDVIFAFCEFREREVFGKRAVGVGTCKPFQFFLLFFYGEKWCDSKRESLRIYLIYQFKI